MKKKTLQNVTSSPFPFFDHCTAINKYVSYPSPVQVGGGDVTPNEFFWNGHRTAAAGPMALKFGIVYGASFTQLLVKNLTGSGQVTEL